MVAGAIKTLVNARNVQFECARVLRESLLVTVLTTLRKNGHQQ